MRPLFKILAGLLVLILVEFGVIFYQLNTLVKEAVLQVGPQITGTPVELDTRTFGCLTAVLLYPGFPLAIRKAMTNLTSSPLIPFWLK